MRGGRRTERFFRPWRDWCRWLRPTHRSKRWAMVGRPQGASAAETFSNAAQTPEYLEWVWTAMSQGAGNKMVTCVKSASYRVVLAAGADAGCHVRPRETGVEEGSYERISVRNTGGLPTRQSAKQQGSDFLIQRFGRGKVRKFDEPDSPGEGTRPTGIPVPVGTVPSPGVSRILRGIRKSEVRQPALHLAERRRSGCRGGGQGTCR